MIINLGSAVKKTWVKFEKAYKTVLGQKSIIFLFLKITLKEETNLLKAK